MHHSLSILCWRRTLTKSPSHATAAREEVYSIDLEGARELLNFTCGDTLTNELDSGGSASLVVPCIGNPTHYIYSNHAGVTGEWDPQFRYVLPVSVRGVALVLHAPLLDITVVARPSPFADWTTIPAPRKLRQGAQRVDYNLYIFRGCRATAERQGVVDKHQAPFESIAGGSGRHISSVTNVTIGHDFILGVQTSPFKIRYFVHDPRIAKALANPRCCSDTTSHMCYHKIQALIENLNDSLAWIDPPVPEQPVWLQCDGETTCTNTRLLDLPLKMLRDYRLGSSKEELNHLLVKLGTGVATSTTGTAQLAVVRIDLEALKQVVLRKML